jgi:hypothetical protein
MRTTEVVLAIIITLMLFAAVRCDDGVSPVPPPENFCKYLPTDLGNQWEYKVTVESMSSPREEYKLTMKIEDTKNSEGVPLAYVVSVTEDGRPARDIIVAPVVDTCYVERVGWAYLIADDMQIGEWSQTGLVDDRPLEYVRDVKVTVPPAPGKSGKEKKIARELYRDTENEFEPEMWAERFVENIGPVYYEYNFKRYQIDPFELVDWRVVKYELTAYNIVARE